MAASQGSPGKRVKCPVCKRMFDPATSTAPPFCTPRCRQIDLGRWLGEDYAVSIEKFDEDEQPEEGYPEEE